MSRQNLTGPLASRRRVATARLYLRRFGFTHIFPTGPTGPCHCLPVPLAPTIHAVLSHSRSAHPDLPRRASSPSTWPEHLAPTYLNRAVPRPDDPGRADSPSRRAPHPTLSTRADKPCQPAPCCAAAGSYRLISTCQPSLYQTDLPYRAMAPLAVPPRLRTDGPISTFPRQPAANLASPAHGDFSYLAVPIPTGSFRLTPLYSADTIRAAIQRLTLPRRAAVSPNRDDTPS